jgi:hypothetical protein
LYHHILRVRPNVTASQNSSGRIDDYIIRQKNIYRDMEEIVGSCFYGSDVTKAKTVGEFI